MTKAPSVEPVLRSRLLPRISFKVMLFLTTFSAVVAAVARIAGNGGELAKAVMTSIGFVAACFAAFAILFLISWSVAVARKQSGVGAFAFSVLLLAAEQLGLTVGGIFLPMLFIAAGLFLILVPVRETEEHVGNPFAEGQLPPQILPPREQRT
jgi:hypothetical protein